ncbi:hypothetical protein H4219_005340 [Mycoemilia scoparia]|uniref:RRM domain-containing protein n=1 Tax=Mycoemilia scoparia TaxID=417184 RepID=A0A9W8DK17_9FUNG|nr:hypothetical protein H4219_005340 [Mycoemilia scoparia]
MGCYAKKGNFKETTTTKVSPKSSIARKTLITTPHHKNNNNNNHSYKDGGCQHSDNGDHKEDYGGGGSRNTPKKESSKVNYSITNPDPVVPKLSSSAATPGTTTIIPCLKGTAAGTATQKTGVAIQTSKTIDVDHDDDSRSSKLKNPKNGDDNANNNNNNNNNSNNIDIIKTNISPNIIDTTTPADNSSSSSDSDEEKGHPEACIFIGSLLATCSDSELECGVRQEFGKFGPIIQVKILRNEITKPYGFVQFKASSRNPLYVKDANKILENLESIKIKVYDREVRIEPAHGQRSLYITRINTATSLGDILDVLKEFGKIEDSELLDNDKISDHGGQAFIVKYRHRDDAMKALKEVKERTGGWVARKADSISAAAVAATGGGIYNASNCDQSGGGGSSSSSGSSSGCGNDLGYQRRRRYSLGIANDHHHDYYNRHPSYSGSKQFRPYQPIKQQQQHQNTRRTSSATIAKMTRRNSTNIDAASATSQGYWPYYYQGGSYNTRNAVQSGGLNICDMTTVFVGQINPSKATKTSIRNHFEIYGEIESINVQESDIQFSPPSLWAIIKYKEVISAVRAIKHENNKSWYGRNLKVDFKRPPPANKSGMWRSSSGGYHYQSSSGKYYYHPQNYQCDLAAASAMFRRGSTGTMYPYTAYHPHYAAGTGFGGGGGGGNSHRIGLPYYGYSKAAASNGATSDKDEQPTNSITEKEHTGNDDGGGGGGDNDKGKNNHRFIEISENTSEGSNDSIRNADQGHSDDNKPVQAENTSDSMSFSTDEHINEPTYPTLQTTFFPDYSAQYPYPAQDPGNAANTANTVNQIPYIQQPHLYWNPYYYNSYYNTAAMAPLSTRYQQEYTPQAHSYQHYYPHQFQSEVQNSNDNMAMFKPAHQSHTVVYNCHTSPIYYGYPVYSYPYQQLYAPQVSATLPHHTTPAQKNPLPQYAAQQQQQQQHLQPCNIPYMGLYPNQYPIVPSPNIIPPLPSSDIVPISDEKSPDPTSTSLSATNSTVVDNGSQRLKENQESSDPPKGSNTVN